MFHFHYTWIFLEESHWNSLKSTTPGLHHGDQNLNPLHREGSLRCLWFRNVRGLHVNNSSVSAFWSIPETWRRRKTWRKKIRVVWSCTGSQIYGPVLPQSLLLLPSEVSVISFSVKASAGKLLSAQPNVPISVFISEGINLRLPFLTTLRISV